MDQASQFWTIRIGDVITIAAVLLAPLLAVQVQWRLQLWREKRERKVWTFKTLMATRGTPIAIQHVQALNMIDVEFDGKNQEETAVRERWKVYLDFLSTPFDWANATDVVKQTRTEQTNDKLAELLQKMGKLLGYHFDTVYLKKHVYVPVGHHENESIENIMRKALARVLAGLQPLKMDVVSLPVTITDEEAEQQARIRRALLELLENKKPWPVKVVED